MFIFNYVQDGDYISRDWWQLSNRARLFLKREGLAETGAFPRENPPSWEAFRDTCRGYSPHLYDEYYSIYKLQYQKWASHRAVLGRSAGWIKIPSKELVKNKIDNGQILNGVTLTKNVRQIFNQVCKWSGARNNLPKAAPKKRKVFSVVSCKYCKGKGKRKVMHWK